MLKKSEDEGVVAEGPSSVTPDQFFLPIECTYENSLFTDTLEAMKTYSILQTATQHTTQHILPKTTARPKQTRKNYADLYFCEHFIPTPLIYVLSPW